MKNNTYRTNYLQEVNIDGVTQYDLGSMDFSKYNFGELSYYFLQETDIGRPDIVSQRLYGTTNYSWFLMKFNKISDIWNDMQVNQRIVYPNIEIVREIFKQYNIK